MPGKKVPSLKGIKKGQQLERASASEIMTSSKEPRYGSNRKG